MKDSSRMNFKHLRYFAEVAQRGSVTQAARALFVAPQTVSAQVQELEQSVGQPLFERAGRRLVLTAAGETALDYAKSIFAMGDELRNVLRGRLRPKNIVLRVGSTDSVPKLLTVTVLRPLIQQHRQELELVCREGPHAELLGRVAAGELDMVLTDTAVPAALSRSLQACCVAESGISFLALKTLTKRLARNFPASLGGAPFLVGAAPSSLLGQAIEGWFARQNVRPTVVGRIEDSALLKGLAQEGLGFVAVPTSIEIEVMRQFGLALIGRTLEVRQSTFLIRSRGRRPHPLVAELEELHRAVAST